MSDTIGRLVGWQDGSKTSYTSSKITGKENLIDGIPLDFAIAAGDSD